MNFRAACFAVLAARFAAGASSIHSIDPPSNLLGAGTRSFVLRFQTPVDAECTAELGGKALSVSSTSPRSHAAAVNALAQTGVNEVLLRCSHEPGEALRLLYRVLPVAPASRVARMEPQGMRLGSILLAPASLNAPAGLPEDHYLHDTRGNRIPAGAGAWRLNVTRPDVAAVVGRNVYQAVVAAGLSADGVFFDTAPPRMSLDAEGKRVIPDFDEDGRADFVEQLEPAWARGVERATAAWRQWMPHAYSVTAALRTEPVVSGREAFDRAWRKFAGPAAGLCVVSATPPHQISSGYGEKPFEQAPPATIEFARSSYRQMRFGLGLALLSGCAAQFDLGEAARLVPWNYDEQGVDLGDPAGPPELIPVAGEPAPRNRIANAAFESPLEGSWALFTEGGAGVLAFAERDPAAPAEGRFSVRVTVLDAGKGVPWHVNLYQSNWPLRAGQTYDLEFWAKADAPRLIGLAAQKSAPDWRNYGLWDSVDISTEWRKYKVAFVAGESAEDAQLQFLVGAQQGRVWLDGVSLAEHPPDVLQRSFSKGLVLVNASNQPRQSPVGEGYRTLSGDQAPRVDTILDDADALTAGAWEALRIDSGEWEALPPFYHHWGKGLRQSSDPSATAEWPVAVADGAYEFAAWWPAAPYRGNWTTAAVYELIRDQVVVATAVVDQSKAGGDQWLPLFRAELARPGRYRLRVRNQGEGVLSADAVRLVSAARWNDGLPVRTVELGPFDAVLLQK